MTGARAADRQENMERRNTPVMPHHRRKRLEALAASLDDRFRLPGTNLRFGMDGLIGLIPGIGDTATTALGGYILAEGWRAGLEKLTLAKMAGNLAIDWAVGLVPLVGDLLDFGFKANRKNIQMLLDATHTAEW